ncbi:uncharacterized protein C8A04DRAFT_40456 [Dichotomopilus funicola]|uniref:Extracellular serine-rich protein n=1 Tax=Dichotomopilus funicola TaxID=1934379 RepID=A0AAN6ZHV3_9PEZI|nr:hypothetical protein C8A04DRAFT_40456 [Dichotomopilus funicola]
MLTNILLLTTAALLPLTSAVPVAGNGPSKTLPVRDTATYTAPRITHSVVAGRSGLHFDPENIFASIGDIVEFHFLPANHSVVQASFDAPCVPQAPSDANPTPFSSGFFPVSPKLDGSVQQNPEVFQIEIKDDKPVWFYCAQTKGRHCQSGMVGSVNQKVDSGKTLEAFRSKAAAVQGDSQILGAVQGGWRGPNPNPLSGF